MSNKTLRSHLWRIGKQNKLDKSEKAWNPFICSKGNIAPECYFFPNPQRDKCSLRLSLLTIITNNNFMP